jgi:predicted RNase H-like nuclease (RuvC/YqgF family)
MKKTIIIIAVVIIAGVLLYFLLTDPKQPDSHTADYEQVQADNKILKAHRDSGLKIIDSLQFSISQRDLVMCQMEEQLAGYRKDLDKSTAKATQLAREILALKSDTTERDSKCDSLALEAENFAYLYNAYKSYVDTLTATTNKSLADYRIALNEQKRLYDELQAKYDQLYRLYDVLYKDYGAGQKSLKRERLKTKIAALLALIGGAAAVVK